MVSVAATGSTRTTAALVSIATAVVVVAVAAASAATISKRRRASANARPPRPPTPWLWLPLVGHLPVLMWPALLRRALAGSRSLVRLDVAGVPLIVVQGEENIRFVLNSPDCNGRPGREHALKDENIDASGAGILMNNNLTTWRQNRRFLVQSLMTPGFLKTVIPRTVAYMEHLERYMDRAADSSVPVLVTKLFNLITNDAIFSISSSREAHGAAQYLAELTSTASPTISVSKDITITSSEILARLKSSIDAFFFLNNTPRWMLETIYRIQARRHKRNRNEWLEIVYRLIEETAMRAEESKQSGATATMDDDRTGGGSMDLLTSMLEAVDDETGERMSRLHVMLNWNEALAAGTDTSANTLAFAFYELAKAPHVVAKIRDEVNRNGPITTAAVDRYRYLEAVIKETMRMHPVTIGTSRKARVDMEIDGYHVREGEGFVIFQRMYNDDPDLYPEPKVFDPDRFMSGEKRGYTYFPFGGGTRKCPGQFLAMLEMKAVMAFLCAKYDFFLEDPKLQVREIPGLIIQCGDVPIIFTRADRVF